MLTVRQRGDRWQALVRFKSGGKIVHQETKTFGSEALARSWGEKVEGRVKSVGLPARVRERVTVSKLLTDYLAEIERHITVGRSRAHSLMQVASHPIFQNTNLDDLAASHIYEYANKRREEGAGPATVLHNLASMSAAIGAARAMFGFDVSNSIVTEAIQVLKKNRVVANSNSRSRRLADGELDALVAEFKRVERYPQTMTPMSTIVRLAVVLPRRIGELMRMAWEDYDEAASVITLRDTKHPVKPRMEVVPLSPEANAIIKAIPRVDARILPYKVDTVCTSFERAVARLKIEDLHLHDLRHEGVSRLFERGLSIQEVALISGHTSWATLKRYTHLSPKMVVEKLNASVKRTQEDHPQPA